MLRDFCTLVFHVFLKFDLTVWLVPFVGGIADNIVALVQGLGDAGIVGLIAAIIILGFYK